MTSEETHEAKDDPAPEDHPDEGGSSSAETKAPFAPHEDDDSELGDTDQHSDA